MNDLAWHLIGGAFIGVLGILGAVVTPWEHRRRIRRMEDNIRKGLRRPESFRPWARWKYCWITGAILFACIWPSMLFVPALSRGRIALLESTGDWMVWTLICIVCCTIGAFEGGDAWLNSDEAAFQRAEELVTKGY